MIPITKSQLKPKIVNANSMNKDRQAKQKRYYDRNARARQCFQPGDKVVVRENNAWKPAYIKKVEKTPRSYQLINDKGSEIRRNSSHIKKSMNEPIIINEHLDNEIIAQKDDIKNVENGETQNVTESSRVNEEVVSGRVSDNENVTTTRSGRISRKPEYLKSYVTN